MEGWLALLNSIGKVVSSTMALLEEKERKRLYDQHHNILKAMDEAENASDYYNSDVDNAQRELCIFLEAYGALLGSKNLGALSTQTPKT